MKQALLTLLLMLGGSLFMPFSQANDWPYGSSGFNQTDEGEDEDDENDFLMNQDEDPYGEPPEGESMPEDEEDDFDDPEDEDDFADFGNSTWPDSDDE